MSALAWLDVDASLSAKQATNRLTRTVNGVTESYVYDDGDKLLEVNWPGGSKQYTYDGAGRPTQITSPAGNYLFTWNSQSQLTQLNGPSGTQNFTYNGSGARDSVTKGGVTNHVVRDGTSVLGSIVRQGGQEFKPGVAVRDGLNTTWQHSGLKNFDWQSGGAATISGTKQFDAFGTQIGSTGTWVGPFSHAGPFGYQSDGDIPFQQVGHRWLDPTAGRFLTRDPIQDGRNWYSYGAGNTSPVNGADATGLSWTMGHAAFVSTFLPPPDSAYGGPTLVGPNKCTYYRCREYVAFGFIISHELAIAEIDGVWHRADIHPRSGMMGASDYTYQVTTMDPGVVPGRMVGPNRRFCTPMTSNCDEVRHIVTCMELARNNDVPYIFLIYDCRNLPIRLEYCSYLVRKGLLDHISPPMRGQRP